MICEIGSKMTKGRVTTMLSMENEISSINNIWFKRAENLLIEQLPITIDKGVTTKGCMAYFYSYTQDIGIIPKGLSRYTNKYFSGLNKNTKLQQVNKVGLEAANKAKMQADEKCSTGIVTMRI